MRFILTVLVLFTVKCVLAQDYKFGKVTKEEVSETVYPEDTIADAAYLYKYRKSHYVFVKDEGFVLKTDIHERIKIYNQEGFNYATKQIRLYNGSSGGEKISSIKAYTYNFENGKVVSEKISKNDIFKSEVSKYTNQVKFTMPNIKPGSVIEYKYEITSPYWSNVDEFVFQHDIPIKRLEASFEVPEYFNFKVNTKGFLPLVPEIENQTGVIRSFGGAVGGNQSSSYNVSETTYFKQISKYKLDNVPALRDEPFVNSINNYRASAKYELSYTNFPNSTIKYYSTTWEDVVNTVYKSSYFGEELERTGYFKNDIDALLGSRTDPKEKISLIYNYVKSQVKWNGYYGFYSDDVKKAYKDHVGGCGEINLMLTAMMRYAGLDANPVLVSTRSHGVPLFPTREGYNYVVTLVKVSGDSMVLLDATDPYAVPNVLPMRALNWKGRIVGDNGTSSLIDLYPRNKSKNAITMMVKIDEEGTLEGSCRSIRTNHRALSFRNRYNDTDKEEFLEKLENRYGGLEVSDYEVKNDKDLSKPVMESYKFVKENQADVIGDKMYFSPLFYMRTDENPFKLENREFPVDFGYPSITSQRIIINIPEGYKIDSVPEDVAIGLPDNLGSFNFKIVGRGNTIQVSVVSQINESIILPAHYEALKEYFNKYVQKEAEQVVLTRI
ncbi:DUF3857 domain-containing protein [Seonamhaeicola sp. ML3]|uniref:DUF3857 domain-containing protein n=1 Tax=Seonamhaeicola sp. ML3 TaxID=2937786 RepID=UPI0020101696|nr:DUF3857 domain-containing protein [Seonamhaeicola sp. ML3]